jgi:hypothetical protein
MFTEGINILTLLVPSPDAWNYAYRGGILEPLA